MSVRMVKPFFVAVDSLLWMVKTGCAGWLLMYVVVWGWMIWLWSTHIIILFGKFAIFFFAKERMLLLRKAIKIHTCMVEVIHCSLLDDWNKWKHRIYALDLILSRTSRISLISVLRSRTSCLSWAKSCSSIACLSANSPNSSELASSTHLKRCPGPDVVP